MLSCQSLQGDMDIKLRMMVWWLQRSFQKRALHNPALTQTGLSPEGKRRDFFKFGCEQSCVRVKPARLVTPSLGQTLATLASDPMAEVVSK